LPREETGTFRFRFFCLERCRFDAEDSKDRFLSAVRSNDRSLEAKEKGVAVILRLYWRTPNLVKDVPTVEGAARPVVHAKTQKIG